MKQIINEFEGQSGFFDLTDNQSDCNSSDHNPPTHLFIPEGKGYKHVCPTCGKTTIIKPQQIKF